MQEVKFKSTDIGLIPEDWDFVEIGSQVAALNAGTSVNSDASIITPDSRYVLRTSAVSSGVFIPSERKVVAAKDYDRVSCPVQHGAAIISRMNTPELVGETVYVEDDLKNTYLPDRLWQTELKPDSKMNCQWFSFIMNSPEVHETVVQVATGTSGSMHNVGKEAFLNLCIPYPSPDEQNNIAEAISDIDKLIDEYNCIVAKKRNIRAGAVQDLLSGKVRLFSSNSKMVETEIGYLPEDWGEPVALDSIGSWSHGTGVKRDDAGSGLVPCIRYGEIYTTHHDYIKEIQTYISQEVADTAKLLKKGDILFAASGETKEEIAKAVAFVSDTPAYAGGDIIILSPKDDYDPMYLGYVLNIPVVNAQKAERGQGDAVVHIHKEQLASVVIPVPSTKDEQHLIAQVLSDMDAEIQALEEEKEKYINIKQGMMQQLLTGNIRLI